MKKPSYIALRYYVLVAPSMQNLTSKNEAKSGHDAAASMNISAGPKDTADQVVVFITGALDIQAQASITAPIEMLNDNATYFFQLDHLQMQDSTIALTQSGPASNFVLNTSKLNMTNSKFDLAKVSNTEIRAERIDMCSQSQLLLGQYLNMTGTKVNITRILLSNPTPPSSGASLHQLAESKNDTKTSVSIVASSNLWQSAQGQLTSDVIYLYSATDMQLAGQMQPSNTSLRVDCPDVEENEVFQGEDKDKIRRR